MNTMKKHKKFIIILLIILLIIINILIKLIFSSGKFNSKEDLIFFKLFGQSNTKSTIASNYERASTPNIYIFDVEYQNMNFKNIDLINTVDNKTLVNEKIAPGTNGEFDIVLTSNKNLKYYVKFESKNQKPKNLVFSIKGKDETYQTLEEMQKDLIGNIKQGEEKVITVLWKWKYESGGNEDFQDTYDGINLSKYNFNIYTIGGEYD